MTDEERRPLLGDDAQHGPSLPRTEEPDAPWENRTAGDEPSNRKDLLDLASRVAAVAVNFSATGLAASAVGAMIPKMETYYDLKNGPTAFIFPAALVGYLLAVSCIERIHQRFGRRGIALLGPVLRVLASAVLMLGSPFPVTLIGYLVLGMGTGLTDSGFCAWGSGVPFTNIVQGIIHGSWSIGCVLGPQLVALLLRNGYPWYAFYRVLAFACCIEFIALGLAFRKDSGVVYREVIGDHAKIDIGSPLAMKETWMCGLFWFVYVGIESSYGDWIVTYMDTVRHVDHLTAASASSVFWIGMVTGRVFLSPLTERCGLQWSFAAYIVLSIIAQTVFQALNSVAALLFALSMVGFFFGPFFPSGIVLLGKKLPVHAHVGAISAAAALGQVGGAICPLIVGFIADAFGMAKLLDVASFLTILLLGIWVAFCRT